MTFYQELQLSSTGSKQLIRNTTDKKEKRRHILIYNFKVYLVMAFCVAVVTLYSKITGNDNSVVGVTVLLAVLVLRQADFGIRTTHGLLSIAGIFSILIIGPRLSNMVSPVPAFFVNAVSILLLMILGCHNVIMYNHSTFVLGYLLLMGYDVTGKAYVLRVEGLLVGMILCMVIFYKNQKNRPYRRTFLDLFRDFQEQCGPESPACLCACRLPRTVKAEPEKEVCSTLWDACYLWSFIWCFQSPCILTSE